MQRHWVVVRHWSDVDWRRYRQEYINECSNYLWDPPRSNHPVIMLTSGRSHAIFVIDVHVVVGRSVGRCAVSVSVSLFSLPQVMLLLLVLLLDDYGPVTMLVGTRSRRRTEYVVVSMVVRVRARRRWSRLDVDWKERRHWRPAEEMRLGGGSDEEWRVSCVITCIYRNSPCTCIGDPCYSNKPAITRYCAFLLSYLPSALLLHFRNMNFRWQNPFRKVFLTIRKMFRNVFLPVRMTISGTWISALLSPQVHRHAGVTYGEYRTRLVNEIVFFSAAAGSVGGVERYLGELN